VLATGRDFPDALATAPLAGALDGPVLLIGQRLDGATAAALDGLGAARATVVGGIGAVPLVAQVDVAAGGLAVERIAGEQRADTAALIARASAPGGAEMAVVVTSGGFADALSMSALAAAEGLPVLVTGRDRLHPDTAAALRELGVRRTLVAGGAAALADGVVADLPDARRLAGADRYATSVAVAEEVLARGGSLATVVVATGRDFPDGLVGGVLAGRTGSPLLLVDGADPEGSPASWAFLEAHAGQIGRILVLGGAAAVSDAVVARLAALGGGAGGTGDDGAADGGADGPGDGNGVDALNAGVDATGGGVDAGGGGDVDTGGGGDADGGDGGVDTGDGGDADGGDGGVDTGGGATGSDGNDPDGGAAGAGASEAAAGGAVGDG
jgi:hypothetical protein